ncbi:hypothetical protein SDC9_100203 [bioreactor metagenome]|uniref:Uncharacterized protein n=1 Tax=bioreactor metagenome TaxID=1076179 RepID=A0A645AJN8_9ZZZZ
MRVASLEVDEDVGMAWLKRMTLGMLPIDGEVGWIIGGEIKIIFQQPCPLQVLLHKRIPVKMGHAMVGDENDIGFVEIDGLQDLTDILVYLPVGFPYHMPAKRSSLFVVNP